MNWDRIKGNWNQVKGELMKQWGELTETDLDVVAGEREKLVGRLQDRYGIVKEKAEQQIDEWLASYRSG
jgi:uncharacterized protein YjbJ (UPF0337 family)